MKKHFTAAFLCFCYLSSALAQAQWANYWPLDLGVALDFSGGQPQVVNACALQSFEASGAICNDQGQLGPTGVQRKRNGPGPLGWYYQRAAGAFRCVCVSNDLGILRGHGAGRGDFVAVIGQMTNKDNQAGPGGMMMAIRQVGDKCRGDMEAPRHLY